MKVGILQPHASPALEPEYLEVEAAQRSGSILEALRHAVGNVLVAMLFFSALAPHASRYGSGIADDIWLLGAVVMGVLSLVRVPPKSVMLDWQALVSNVGALVTPALIRPGIPALGVLAAGGIVIEIIGIVLSQTARVYMGRRFGILPANRGIVSKGPFALIRHPIYVGWFLLSMGLALAYPSARNFACVALAVPFMAWRIVLEERVLMEDREYRTYCGEVRWRLFPGIV
jgi:protein-S-isoprenylcysteine O-methyltransferase Ste14